MTRDDIIKLAREAGLVGGPVYAQGLKAFATLVAAAEREACARVCESAGPDAGPIYCAFAIRARNKTQSKKTWNELTDEYLEKLAETHHKNCYFDTLTYARAIIAKLKELND